MLKNRTIAYNKVFGLGIVRGRFKNHKNTDSVLVEFIKFNSELHNGWRPCRCKDGHGWGFKYTGEPYDDSDSSSKGPAIKLNFIY